MPGGGILNADAHLSPAGRTESRGSVRTAHAFWKKNGTGVPELILLCCAESGRESPEDLSEKIFMIAFSEGVF